MSRCLLSFAMLTVAACDQANERKSEPVSRQAQPAVPAPGTGPDAKTPLRPVGSEHRRLSEPKGPIDARSVEAAGQVVQHYAALIEQKRFDEASKLWGEPAAAAAFAKSLPLPVHLTIGDLGPTEGAAGSIYTTVPVTFYGDGFRKAADIILRRVNDVPGSTADQRRWHIERIDWVMAG
jgi:hypothetical protein